jgi:hypothetical protein
VLRTRPSKGKQLIIAIGRVDSQSAYCGMTTSRSDRYYCSARREKGICDADRGISAVELEERVLKG